jgi:hypothetical protein
MPKGIVATPKGEPKSAIADQGLSPVDEQSIDQSSEGDNPNRNSGSDNSHDSDSEEQSYAEGTYENIVSNSTDFGISAAQVVDIEKSLQLAPRILRAKREQNLALKPWTIYRTTANENIICIRDSNECILFSIISQMIERYLPDNWHVVRCIGNISLETSLLQKLACVGLHYSLTNLDYSNLLRIKNTMVFYYAANGNIPRYSVLIGEPKKNSPLSGLFKDLSQLEKIVLRVIRECILRSDDFREAEFQRLRNSGALNYREMSNQGMYYSRLSVILKDNTFIPHHIWVKWGLDKVKSTLTEIEQELFSRSATFYNFIEWRKRYQLVSLELLGALRLYVLNKRLGILVQVAGINAKDKRNRPLVNVPGRFCSSDLSLSLTDSVGSIDRFKELELAANFDSKSWKFRFPRGTPLYFLDNSEIVDRVIVGSKTQPPSEPKVQKDTTNPVKTDEKPKEQAPKPSQKSIPKKVEIPLVKIEEVISFKQLMGPNNPELEKVITFLTLLAEKRSKSYRPTPADSQKRNLLEKELSGYLAYLCVHSLLKQLIELIDNAPLDEPLDSRRSRCANVLKNNL